MNLSLSSSSRSSVTAVTQAGLLAGPFLSMLDSNIVNVALPDIAVQLHSPLETAQWIVSGYLLALAAVLAASAYLAKRFGTSRVYLVSLLGFTLASALCALAPTMGVLIAARALQGALGAPLVPLAMGMLLGQGGAARQMPAAAGIVLFLAPAIGPTIGGLLLHLGGWPLIFLINVPFGLLGAFGIGRLVRRRPVSHQPRTHFDVVGLLLLSSGLVLAIYGATQGAQFGWTTLSSWPYLVCGLCLLALYVVWAFRHAHPAVDLKVLRHPQPGPGRGTLSPGGDCPVCDAVPHPCVSGECPGTLTGGCRSRPAAPGTRDGSGDGAGNPTGGTPKHAHECRPGHGDLDGQHGGAVRGAARHSGLGHGSDLERSWPGAGPDDPTAAQYDDGEPPPGAGSRRQYALQCGVAPGWVHWHPAAGHLLCCA